MTSPTDVCNLALIELAAEPIADIDDIENENARRMKAVFDQVRDATLRAHPWNFAITLAHPAKEGTAPLFGFANSFRLPTDPFCLRVLQVNQDRDAKFKVRGRSLHTDSDAPLELEFIARVVDGSQWDANFVQAFGLNLAQTNAFKITASRAAEKEVRDKYVQFLREARSIDGQEGSADDPQESEFLAARAGAW